MIRHLIPPLLAFVAFTGAARAEIKASALDVAGGCASGGTIAIDPDPTLSGRLVLDGPVAAAPAVRADGTVAVAPSCGDETLRIRVPPAFPVRIEATGDRAIHLGDLGGPVSLDVTGGDVSAGALAGPLRVAGTGDDDMTIASLSGPAEIALRGSGDLSIGRADMPTLSLTMMGSGDVRIGGGTVAHLDLVMRGSGDVRIAGTVGDGSVNDAGDGDVAIDRVTGNLSEVQAGSGSIHVGERGGGSSAPTTAVTIAPPTHPAPPAISIETPHVNFRADTESDVEGAVRAAVRLLMLVVLGTAAFLLVRRRRRQRRLLAEVSAPVRDPAVASLAGRLDAVGRRIGAIEQVVTSDEFDLDRRFRDIGAGR